MIKREVYDDFKARIEAAWGLDMTPEIDEAFKSGSFRVISSMRRSVIETLDPATIVTLIDDGQVERVRHDAEKCIPRKKLIEELAEIWQQRTE